LYALVKYIIYFSNDGVENAFECFVTWFSVESVMELKDPEIRCYLVFREVSMGRDPRPQSDGRLS
jgi:hypothetical protein